MLILYIVESFSKGGYSYTKTFTSNHINIPQTHGSLGKNVFSISRIINRSQQNKNLYILSMATLYHSFNPFLGRNKNTNVKWYETELENFYEFVEKQPLLTAEQELQYGKALQMWTQIEAVRRRIQLQSNITERLSDQYLSESLGCSHVALEKLSKYADISRTRLLNSNLKLVLAIVSRYRTSGIPNSELIAEGTRGLAKSVLRFDYTKGFRFATYATWYVHQAVSEYVRWRKHPAKMPSRYLLLLRKVKQFSTDHKTATGFSPTVQEIADGLGQSHFDVIKVLSMQTYPSLLNTPISSQNSKAPDGKTRSLEDVLPSLYKAPLAETDSKDLRRDMENMMLTNLNDIERDILRLRLGLDDGRVKPIKEVGKRFKISWKQVRSVEKEALTKLAESREINEFVDSYHSV